MLSLFGYIGLSLILIFNAVVDWVSPIDATGMRALTEFPLLDTVLSVADKYGLWLQLALIVVFLLMCLLGSYRGKADPKT